MPRPYRTILRTAIAILATITIFNLAQETAHAQKVEKPVAQSDVKSARDQTGRPNILFIAIDDLRPELGCYGAEHAISPSLDRLASQSVLFRRHFVQVPTCGASRFALLTGRSPTSTNVVQNNAFYQGPNRLSAEPLPGAQTFPELFRRSGYHTVCIGKISHTPDGRVFAYNGSGDGRHELPNAWDQLPTPFGPWQRGWGTFFAYAEGKHREDGNNNKDLMQFTAQADSDLPDGMMADTAIEKLAELKKRRDETGQPFLMGLGFFKPHLPFVATQQDWDAFNDVDIPVARHGDKIDAIGWHRSGEFYKYAMQFEKTRPMAIDDQRQAKRAYLACVRYVDRQVGRVLKKLDELDLSDNTIVVVWGDHGWHLGESAIWGKHSPFDRSLQSALMIRAPGVSLAGHRCDQLVESIDLYPTLLDLAGPSFKDTAHDLEGKSLRSLLVGGNDPVRQVSLSCFGKGLTARTQTHRLVADGKGKLQFYRVTDSIDPLRDVKNNDNVSGNASESDAAALRKLLKQLAQRPELNRFNIHDDDDP